MTVPRSFPNIGRPTSPNGARRGRGGYPRPPRSSGATPPRPACGLLLCARPAPPPPSPSPGRARLPPPARRAFFSLAHVAPLCPVPSPVVAAQKVASIPRASRRGPHLPSLDDLGGGSHLLGGNNHRDHLPSYVAAARSIA